MASNIPSVELDKVTITGSLNRKVRITGPGGEQLIFEVSAPLTESRSASYDPYSIVHLPTSLFSYRSTSSRRWSISGRMVSRTVEEARENSYYLDLARRWVQPEFGSTGATPPILRVFGYGNDNLDNRPVVLTSYEWSFVEDVDYIAAPGEQAMPIIGTLTLTIDEIYSPEEISNGSWQIKHRAEDRGEITTGASALVSSLVARNFTRQGQSGVRNFETAAMTSIASQLELAGGQGGIKPTIAGVVAGSLTRSIATSILNSQSVQEATRQLPPVVRNIFVSGANVLIQQTGRAVTTGVSAGTQAPLTDEELANKQFNRSDELPPPPITEP